MYRLKEKQQDRCYHMCSVLYVNIALVSDRAVLAKEQMVALDSGLGVQPHKICAIYSTQ